VRVDKQRRTREWFCEAEGQALRRSSRFLIHNRVATNEAKYCKACYVSKARSRRCRSECSTCLVSVCDLCWTSFHDDVVLNTAEWFAALPESASETGNAFKRAMSSESSAAT
jgi:hypothetical protein